MTLLFFSHLISNVKSLLPLIQTLVLTATGEFRGHLPSACTLGEAPGDPEMECGEIKTFVKRQKVDFYVIQETLAQTIKN